MTDMTNDTTTHERDRRAGESEASWANRISQRTGATMWLEGDGPSRAIPETLWHAGAAVGERVGSWVRTGRTHEGMTVWERD